MASGKVTVKMSKQGSRDVLKSLEVRSDLEARARRIAAAAGPGNEVEVQVGKERARAAIVTTTAEAMRREATDRSLTSALDAGR